MNTLFVISTILAIAYGIEIRSKRGITHGASLTSASLSTPITAGISPIGYGGYGLGSSYSGLSLGGLASPSLALSSAPLGISSYGHALGASYGSAFGGAYPSFGLRSAAISPLAYAPASYGFSSLGSSYQTLGYGSGLVAPSLGLAAPSLPLSTYAATAPISSHISSGYSLSRPISTGYGHYNKHWH